MPLTIRPATIDDGDAIATLFMKTWRISLIDIIPNGFLDQFSHERQRQKYSERAANGSYILLVAEEEDGIVGMIAATGNDTEPMSYEWQIKSMYVDPDFQRSGIGTILFNNLIAHLRLRGQKNVMLWCIKNNKSACAFYEKHGGKRIENITQPAEYSAMPHVIYAWDLQRA